MATSIQVTFDCADPNRLAGFWAEALGYKVQEPPPGFSSWPEFLKSQNVPETMWDMASAVVDPEGKGPRLFFQKVPEAKTVKNRVHLDLNVGGPRSTPPEERLQRVEAEIKRLTGLGGAEVRRGAQLGDRWVVMADPEGNEFCLQ